MRDTLTWEPVSLGRNNGRSFNRVRIMIDEPEIDWWPNVCERLEGLIRLPEGWDGYSAEPVGLGNAAFALRVLETICHSGTPAPQIVPGTEGDLQLEWHVGSFELELHVVAPNNVHFWFCSNETEEEGREFLLKSNFIEVEKIIKKMTEYALHDAAAAA